MFRKRISRCSRCWLLLSVSGVVVDLLSIILDDVDYRLWLFLACITGSLIVVVVGISIVTVAIVIVGVLILTQIIIIITTSISISISIGSINISIVTKSTSTTTATSQIHPLTIIFISINSL